MQAPKRPRASGDVASTSGAPLMPPFVTDYRPYGSGLLDRYLHKRHADTDHKKSWDLYYRNNTVNGYKNRHYILREFHELRASVEAAVAAESVQPDSSTDVQSPRASPPPSPSPSFSWMEAGCGVGNAFLPVFAEYGHLAAWRRMVGFDISSVAIQLLRTKVHEDLPAALQQKVVLACLNPVEQDICTQPDLFPSLVQTEEAKKKRKGGSESKDTRAPLVCSGCLPEGEKVQFVSMIFVLCSIPTHAHAEVLRRVAACMPVGGIFFFRDYAVSDHAETRFRLRKRHTHEPPMPGDTATGEQETAAEDGGSERESSKSTSDSTYTRTNGTLSHFFSVEEATALFQSVGFRVLQLGEVEREVQNAKLNVSLNRKFIQGRFVLEKAVQ